jgi:hypothetical protein
MSLQQYCQLPLKGQKGSDSLCRTIAGRSIDAVVFPELSNIKLLCGENPAACLQCTDKGDEQGTKPRRQTFFQPKASHVPQGHCEGQSFVVYHGAFLNESSPSLVEVGSSSLAR